MSLLQTMNIDSKRQRLRPLNEASPFRLMSNPITVERKDRQNHEEGKKEEQQQNLDKETIWNLEPQEANGVLHRKNKMKHKLDPKTEGKGNQKIIWN